MLEISRSKIKEYFSLEVSHVDLTRLNLTFEHVPHYGIYHRRIRTLIGERIFNHRSLKDLLQLIKDLIALCTRDNLQISFDLLKDDLAGRMGDFELTPENLRLPGKNNEHLVHQAIQGHSVFAFGFHVLLLLDLRLREDDQALNLHSSLGERLRKLSLLQMETQRKVKTSEQQVVSEFIVAHSAALLKDLGSISNLSLSSDIRISVSKHKNHVGNLLKEEIESLDLRISDALIFLSQLNKLSKSSKAYEAKCRKSLSKIGRELMGISYLITGAEKAVNDKEILRGEVMDNVRLNLFFAMLLLPHSDVFRGKYQSAIEGRLMQLSHYANYLHDIDFGKVAHITFPQDCQLSYKELPAFAGRKAIDIVKLVGAVEAADTKNSNYRWDLYLAIELHLRNHIKNREELQAVIALKKLLVYQMLQRHSAKSMHSLESIRDTILGLESGIKGSVYLPEDVISILRDVCHCFSQLLNEKDDQHVKNLYRNHQSPMAYYIQEKMPKSYYRRQTDGSIRRANSADQTSVGDKLDHLLEVLCDSCERNLERDPIAMNLDRVIKEHAPYEGGLLEILDDPERLRKLMETPIIKNQSLNKKKLIQLLNLTRTILAS